MTFCVYAIQNQTGRIYIGQTVDFCNRLLIHNKGGVRSTAADRPWHAVKIEEFPTRESASSRLFFSNPPPARHPLLLRLFPCFPPFSSAQMPVSSIGTGHIMRMVALAHTWMGLGRGWVV